MPRMIHDKEDLTSRNAVSHLALHISFLFASFIYNMMKVKCKAQSGKLKQS